MTTLHLGDCLNGCATCADNYHSTIEQEVCGACGQFFPSTEADEEGFHSTNYCDEARFACGSCGYQFAQDEGITFQQGTYLEFICTSCYEGKGN